jgi:hypothetical protein
VGNLERAASIWRAPLSNGYEPASINPIYTLFHSNISRFRWRSDMPAGIFDEPIIFIEYDQSLENISDYTHIFTQGCG